MWRDKYRLIEFETDSSVLIVRFARDQHLNAIDARLHTEMSWLFRDLTEHSDARAIVLTGKGKAFWEAEVAKMIKTYKASISEADAKAIADYLSRIRGKIRGNIVLPPDVKGNPEAIFDVTQLPSGEIVTARLRRSSGNTALDEAIERAILKSNPLPKPEKSDLFSRTLELSFRPLDE